MTVCTTLANGVRILSRPLPGRRSAALGFWLHNGARHDRPGESGYAHLLEHLLFRGSGRYAPHFEALGGHVNARTGRELTVFHGLVTADRLRLLARLFTSQLLDPRLGGADLAAELPAVRHEQRLAAADRDGQEDFVLARVWGAHPLARSISGASGDLAAVAPAAMQACHHERLTGASLWIVAAGAVDHDALVDACRTLERLPAGARAHRQAPTFTPCRWSGGGGDETAELLWVMPAPAPADPTYWAFVLGEQIAAGMPLSARLLQELRERCGLVYAVNSRVDLHSDCGLWWIRLRCEAALARVCRNAVEAVMAELVERGPEREELIRALAQQQARWTLEEDDPECVMERIGHEIACLDRVTALNERLARLTVAEPADVRMALAAAWRQRAAFEWGSGDEEALRAGGRAQMTPPVARRAG